MTHVNVQAAKAHLPELLDLVEQGEQVAIVHGEKTARHRETAVEPKAHRH